jgi:uncharacterized protein
MILPDINIWVSLAVSNHAHHPAAVRWLETQEAPESVAFCRVTQQGYLRLLSNDKLMKGYGVTPRTNAQVWDLYQALLADYRMTFLPEPEDIEGVWRDFGARETVSTKLWMDAFLAAFAVAGEHELVTFDAGFQQFDGLKLNLLTP